jgi:hypothetical protein
MADNTKLNLERIRACDGEDIWRTIRGAKVLIDEGTGEIKGGAGGKMNGRKYKPSFGKSLKTGKKVLLPNMHTKFSHHKGSKAELLHRLKKAVEPGSKNFSRSAGNISAGLTDIRKMAIAGTKIKTRHQSPLGSSSDEWTIEDRSGRLVMRRMSDNRSYVMSPANLKKYFGNAYELNVTGLGTPEVIKARKQALIAKRITQKNVKLSTGIAAVSNLKTRSDIIRYLSGKRYLSTCRLPTDLKSAQAVAASLTTVFDRYPLLKGRKLQFLTSKLGSNTYGQCRMLSGTVEIGSDYFNDNKKLSASIKKDVRSGFHPAGVDEHSVVVHEYGHAICSVINQLRGTWGHPGFNGKKFVDYVYYDVCGYTDKTTNATIKSAVSGYAAKNHDEFVAEAFSEALCSPNPRKDALLVLQAVDRAMDGLARLEKVQK